MKNKKLLNAKIIGALVLGSVVSTPALAGKMHYYRDSGGAKYKICKDKDGYVVYKPRGGKDSWGTGYSWKNVKSKYGLKKWYKRGTKSYKDCP